MGDRTGSQERAAPKRKPKIYFSGSIRGGRSDQDLYLRLIGYLKRFGDVLTEHVGDEGLTATGEGDLPDTEIYERDLRWIQEADVLVAEVSTPSLGVGYEIGAAERRRIPVLCLFRDRPGRRLSAMVAGNDRVAVGIYTGWDHLTSLVDTFFTRIDLDTSNAGAR